MIWGVAKPAAKMGLETVSIKDSFDGLLEPLNFINLHYQDLGVLLNSGGTILGTPKQGAHGCEKMGLHALVVIGGDGTLSTAQQLFNAGVPVVSIPKTIDNDLDATYMTFGFDSAVALRYRRLGSTSLNCR